MLVDIAADLAGASVAVPELGWSEPTLADGSARLRLILEGDRLTRIDPIAITAGALEADAAIALGAGGAIDVVDITRLKRGGTDVRIGVKRQREREFAISVSGASLDLVPMLEAKSQKNQSDGGPRRTIQIKVDRVRMTPTLSLDAVNATLVHDGSTWRSITLDASSGASGRLKLTMSDTDRGHGFKLTSPDAGALLADLGVLDNLAGGTLEAEGTVDIDSPGLPLEASFDIRDPTVVHAPVLARVAALASLTGVGEAMSGKGIGFSRIGGKLSQDARTITLSDFGAYGPPLALTGKGTIERASDAVHVEATLVPAYGFSQIIGYIPLIGQIITGTKSEGVLAVDFVVDGTLDKPDVKVNPLTAIAPGFLRDIVRLFGPVEGVAQDIQRTERGGALN
jgi:hypothetical protein